MSSQPNRKLLTHLAMSTVASLVLAGTALIPAYAAPIKSILFVNPLPQYPAWRLIGDCAADRAKTLQIPLTETGPRGGTLDATVMIQQIQQGIANNAGAILTLPATSAFTPILRQAKESGAIVGSFWGGEGDIGSDVNIGADFSEVGRIYVDALAKREGPQIVGLMAAAPTGPGKAFVDGFTNAAKKTTNVTVVAVVYNNEDASKALDLTSALLTGHPEINVIATHTGTATQGISAAIKARDLVGKVVSVTNGAAGGGSEGLADGTIYKVMLQDLCGAGSSMIDAVSDISAGKSVPHNVPVGIQMFGVDDYKPFLDKGWQ